MSLLTKFVPFQTACWLRSLQQGALSIGNTSQNIANLLALATTEANTNGVWAKWRSAVNAGQTPANLLLQVKLVPGYVAPPGTYGYAPRLLVPQALNMSAGTFTGAVTVSGISLGSSTFTGYLSGAATHQIGSLPEPAIAALVDTGFFTDVILRGVLAQNAFTSVSFTDSGGSHTFLTASGVTFTTSGGCSHWHWTNSGGAFTAGNNYTVSFT